VLLPTHPDLLFLTSIPYTLGRHPWIIEIEDATTLLLPFHMNGCTSRTPIRRSPYLPILKTLLEADSCRGIITHMRSTAEALPKLFRSEAIAAKTTYVPCGTSLPPVGQDHTATDRLDLLFTCSWHQNPDSFFLRGGLDVLRAFETIHERYPHVRLTLRTGLPWLKPRFRRVLEKCWVRVIDRYLPDDEMDELMRSTHLFVLPAARIHVVSVLRAMAHGQVVVASDGWGFREYVEHGRNGMIVPGRYGKVSWMDDETGMMRENYDPMRTTDSAVTQGLVETISTLVEDHQLRRRLGRQARHDVATRYNLENWNQGLKEALDRAVTTTA
jgi:glycosyltransferase involved in cell wall biosynthesis